LQRPIGFTLSVWIFCALSLMGFRNSGDLVFKEIDRQIEHGQLQKALEQLDLFERAQEWPPLIHKEFNSDDYRQRGHYDGFLTANVLRARIYEKLGDYCAARFFAFRARDIETQVPLTESESEMAKGYDLRTMLNRLANQPSSCAREGGFLPFSNLGSGVENGHVYDVAVLKDGGVLLSGNFEMVRGEVLPGLVHLNPDGTLDDAFTKTFEKSLRKISQHFLEVNNAEPLADGSYLIALTVLNIKLARVFRLDHSGAVDHSFTPWDIEFPETLNQEGYWRLLTFVENGQGEIILGTMKGVFVHKGKNMGPIIMVNKRGKRMDPFPFGPGKRIEAKFIAEQGIGTQENGGIVVAGLFYDSGTKTTSPLGRFAPNGTWDYVFWNKASVGNLKAAEAMAIKKNAIVVTAQESPDPAGCIKGMVRFLPEGDIDPNFVFKGNISTGGFGSALFFVRGALGLKWIDEGILTSGYMFPWAFQPNYIHLINEEGDYDKDFLRHFGASSEIVSDMERLPNGSLALSLGKESFPTKMPYGPLISFQGVSTIDPKNKNPQWPSFIQIRERRGVQAVVAEGHIGLFSSETSTTPLLDLKNGDRLDLIERGLLVDQKNGVADYWQKVKGPHGTVGWVFGGGLSYLPDDKEISQMMLVGVCSPVREGDPHRVILSGVVGSSGTLSELPVSPHPLFGFQTMANRMIWVQRGKDGQIYPFSVGGGKAEIFNGYEKVIDGSPPVTEVFTSQLSLGACAEAGDIYLGKTEPFEKVPDVHGEIMEDNQRLSFSRKAAISFSSEQGGKKQAISRDILKRTWPYEN
jgi:hypothetical protein